MLWAVGDWMYQVVAGLEIDPCGTWLQAHSDSAQPGGGLTHAKCESRDDVRKSLLGLADEGWSVQSVS
jgi:hypothetical protein